MTAGIQRMVNLKLNNMFYAKAMIKPSLKVVNVGKIDFNYWLIWYDNWDWYTETDFENVVWLECNSRPIK